MSEACYHCGDEIQGKPYEKDAHEFCCNGCVMVYSLLQEHQLGSFYDLERHAGKKPSSTSNFKYLFLDQEEIRKKYIDYEDSTIIKITLYLPEIHCSSCIYLLENIQKINPAIKQSSVNFVKKEATFTFDHQAIKLSELANLLEQIGYEANFGNRKESKQKKDKTFLYKLGVAGFAFGSIMLWSFPEYLGVKNDHPEFRDFTSYLSLGVSIPVLFYSASDYFKSAYKALKYKSINLDVPITIGIIVLYAQSLWSILNHEGPGYMDSFSSFIFFLLIGKWFQNLSYQSLSFERDYTSYFPVAITKLENGQEKIVEIEQLNEGDKILIRNEEIIPCDAILLDDSAQIDFSFVTGESNSVKKLKGDFVYAGGKLAGKPIELEVKNKTSRSHLTSLWNELKQEKEHSDKSYQDKMSVYFLIVVLTIALFAGISWFFIDASKITHVIVSILIVTCPCALALSSPFTLGNIMRLLGRKGLYLKNASVIERLNTTTDVVFDKTGTLTASKQQIELKVEDENYQNYLSYVYAVVNASTHPLSLGIKQHLYEHFPLETVPLIRFEELPGKGIIASFEDKQGEKLTVKVGSAAFIGVQNSENYEVNTFISVNDTCILKVVFSSHFRDGLAEMLPKLKNYRLHVLTGDHEKDKQQLQALFPADADFLFEQKPQDKLKYIKDLQDQGRKVLMIGDGLNDAGALNIANVGIAVSENTFRFTPSSDAIIDSKNIVELPYLLKTSNNSKLILKTCLTFSIFYNLIGLSFAISGSLTPLVAAILMPISSITVVFLSTFLVLWMGRK
jgi:P-type Cu+ transporter